MWRMVSWGWAMTPDPFDPCPYPSPRAWHREAFPVVERAVKSGHRAVVAGCTGAGKTDLIAVYVRHVLKTLRPGWVVVVTVPTQALVRQTVERLYKWGVKASPFYADEKTTGQVVVCCNPSVPPLANLLRSSGQRVGLLVADECHRGSGTADVLEPHFQIGLTGTPYKSAGPLEDWDALAFRYSLADALRDGVIVPPKFVHPTEDPDPNDLTAYDYTLGVCREAVGPGVVSATTIADAEWLAAELTSDGVPAAAVHSKLPRTRVEHLLGQLQVGALKCVTNVSLLVEGVDLPWLRWGCIRREEKASVRAIQHLGRYLRHDGERRWGDTVLPAKTEAVIYDRCNSYGLRDLNPDADFGEALAGMERRLARVEEPEKTETPLSPTVVVNELAAWIQELRIHTELFGEPPPDLWEDDRRTAYIGELRRYKEQRWRGLCRLSKPVSSALKALILSPTLERMPTSALADLVHLGRCCKEQERRQMSAIRKRGRGNPFHFRFKANQHLAEPPERAVAGIVPPE